MQKNSWYLSTWFITIMFALWFFIIPLIIGIILLVRINKADKINYEKIKGEVKRLKNWENDLDERESEINQLKIHRQKEVSLIDFAQVIKTVSKIREKEDELTHREEVVNLQEIESKKILMRKQKEAGLIDFTQVIKTVSKIREKEKELIHQENILNDKLREIEIKEEKLHNQKNALVDQENEIVQLIALKQKEISLLDFSKTIMTVTKIREKEEELLFRENELIFQESKQDEIKKEIKLLERQIVNLNDEVLLQSFGFYDIKFFLENSPEYLEYLDLVRSKQKQLVRENRATEYDIIALEESHVKPGSAESKQQIKLAIRAFNSECDAIINKVKFNNVEVVEKKIRDSFYHINKLNQCNSIYLTDEFLYLKLEELFLVHEYTEKKHEEKEEQRRNNELLREQRQAQKELEEELSKIKKEEQHLLNVISQLSSQISDEELAHYQDRLEEIQKQKEEVDYRVKNTRAGYVYIISNIGCFGENVYKIGMTRRLDPMDRVRELGGASVPYHFDVHAMIFSEDAPALEASLHRAFHHRRVNLINERKEFFRVHLSEIKKVVHQNHNAHVEFTMLPEAKEYRETLMLEKKIAKQHII